MNLVGPTRKGLLEQKGRGRHGFEVARPDRTGEDEKILKTGIKVCTDEGT